MGDKYERVRTEAQAREARAQLWHAEDERDAAAKERDFWWNLAKERARERDAARKERDASTDRANRAEKEYDAACKERDAALTESYRLRVDLENYTRREATCKRAAHILTQAGLVSGGTPPKSVYWGWVDQLEEGVRRAAEVTKERDEALRVTELAITQATWERDAARAALDAARAITRRFGEERDALRRRAAQIAELLRAEGDADETP